LSLLKIRGLSKSFGAVVVARKIYLDVGPGAALGILGPNGAGKTSLFGMIAGTLRPDEGSIHLSDTDVTRWPTSRRCRAGLARAFQIPQPFGTMSVFENCLVAATFGAMARGRDAQERSYDALTRCGLSGDANRLAGTLTLLQRKRLELARALATQPRLLLLDEVAGGLVEHECHALVSLIQEIRGSGVTIVWIEHVVHALIAVVDRLVVLNGGKFVADGSPREVMDDPKVAEIYMGIPLDA
jgi:branched-chain amino acid transport system ATP-binding protein